MDRAASSKRMWTMPEAGLGYTEKRLCCGRSGGPEEDKTAQSWSTIHPFGSRRIINYKEVTSVFKHLHQLGYLMISNQQRIGGGGTLFFGVAITPKGMEFLDSNRLKSPLSHIIDVNFSTGNSDIDVRIIHAQELFTSLPRSVEKLRSACVEIASILEDIRQPLKKIADAEPFFQIVNTYGIRHNNFKQVETINSISKLEWIYYTGLNAVILFYNYQKEQSCIE